MRRVWWIGVLLLVIVLLVAGACSGSPGRLRADQRVRILEPKPGSSFTGPVTIRWSSRFDPGEASGLWFVVYVDAAPVPPGQSALVAATEPCDTVPACLARGGLAGPNVFLTADHRIDVGTLPGGAGPEHRLTIVLVDAKGIRQGAVAWNASFRIDPA